MALSVSNLVYSNAGTQSRVTGTIAFDASYPTGGESLTAAAVGLSRFDRITLQDESGYMFETVYATLEPTSVLIKAYQGAAGTTSSTSGGTPAGTNGTSSVSGTGTYTEDATSGALNLATPAFSGTGLTAAGQVITTTDNQTMTLNQCAGMWLISATGATPPNLILSNTAVTGAPAVLTVQGAASTDAGAYKIVKNLTVGSVTALSGTAAAQVFTGSALAGHTHTVGAAAGGEVPNATDLSSLTAVQFEAYGW